MANGSGMYMKVPTTLADCRDIVQHNRLLAALPGEELFRLLPETEPVLLQSKQVLHRAHSVIGAVYFLTGGIVSLVARLERGGSIEVGIIGPEGMVGLPLVLGVGRSPHEALVQVPGSSLRIGADAFRRLVEGCPVLNRLLLRYAYALHAQVAQTAACNGRHLLEKRLARWLLTAHDRVAANSVPLSQDMLSIMLGVRRAGVTEAIGALQRVGAIGVAKASIVILNRQELERASCECYAAVNHEYEQIHHPMPVFYRRDAIIFTPSVGAAVTDELSSK
jgi:CRP-like cAMP-binding protein